MSNNTDKKYYNILLEYLKGHDIFDLIDSNILPFSIQNDYNIILDLVKYDGYALDLASNKLRGDREIVLTAVKQNGLSLEYASNKLRGDKEVVLIAVNNIFIE
jgi:hypothetical protein